ncbi:MAG: hypothetical protein ACRDTE_17410 [Pseudonocardiaceae bacterium]
MTTSENPFVVVGQRGIERARSDSGELMTPQLEQLHRDLVDDGFVRYCCGPRDDPAVLLAYYEWPGYLDLVTIRSYERITAARVPKPVDVFAPQVAVWAYQGPPEPTLRALLHLVHPAHPTAPTQTFPAPPALHVPRALQRPLTIRLPNPSQRTTRAHRLAKAMLARR